MSTAVPISKNLSHRRLIKQRTQQLIDYPLYVPKTTSQLPASKTKINDRRARDAKKCQRRDHETSIQMERSGDTSLSKRLGENGRSECRVDSGKCLAKGERSQKGRKDDRRPFIGKFKSVELLHRKKQNASTLHPSFSVKKLVKSHITASQPRLTSLQNLQTPEQNKKSQTTQQLLPKSETDLKQTLKKSSATKLKLKVKDPFEKRIKLDMQFKDQSAIDRREDSMMSTINQEEFREMLSRIL